MADILLSGAILELTPYWNCRHFGFDYIFRLFVSEYDHGFSLTSLHPPIVVAYRKYACSNSNIITI